MTRLVWLIPLEPAPAHLRTTLTVLEDCNIACLTVGPESLRERLDQDTPPAAVVHGGALTPALFDVQRWLAEFHVPTLVLVEGLTDHYEASLLDRGARDVVALPASRRRLRSRLEALVRPQADGAPQPRMPATVSIAGVIDIYPRRRTVEVNRTRVDLTKSEFDLLLALALSHGDVLPRTELAGAAGKAHLSDRALESHVSRIRMKLRAAGAPDIIDSVRSVGYRLQSTP